MNQSDIERWQNCFKNAVDSDSEAFGEFFQHYLKPQVIYPYAMSLVNNAHDAAEDLVQDVFERLYKKSYYLKIKNRTLKGFAGCVHKITYNAWVTRLRKQRKSHYVITEETLKQLKHAGVEKNILQRLQDMPQDWSAGAYKFISCLKRTLKELFTEELQERILEYSHQERTRWNQFTPEMLNTLSGNENPQEDIEQKEIQEIFETEIRQLLDEDELELVYNKACDEEFSYRKYSEKTGIPLSTLAGMHTRAKHKILNNSKLRMYWKGDAAT